MIPQPGNVKAQKADPKRPWLNDPIVGQVPAQAQAKPWANDPIVQPAQSGKPPPGMVFDPLAPAGTSGFVPAPKPQQDPMVPRSEWRSGLKATLDTAPKPQPWNEGVADFLQQGADFLLAPLMSRDAGPNDVAGEAAKMLASGTANLPAALVRDPAQTIAYDYNPIYQMGMGYKNIEDAGGDVIEGNFGTAGQKALEGAGQLATGALAFTPVKVKPKGVPAPLKATTLQEAKREAAMSSVPSQAPRAAEPSLRQTGKTLAATAVPGRPVRPQAMEALSRILAASNVPADRINAGLAKIVDIIKQGDGLSPGGSARAPTVAQLLEREFKDEYPEVAQNIATVLLERRLTKNRNDASPTIIREAVKDVRGTQASFLTESATQNVGATTRNATRKDMEAALTEFGEEGYKPLISQPIDAARAETIQGVLTGPGMSELGKPLRQIAAGEGKTIEGMIQESPLMAAHWMQHKARLLAEENGGTTLGNAYNAMRNRILATIDDLKTPDGKTYKDLRNEYAETAQIGQSLKAGDQFGAAVKNPEKAAAFIEKFKAATPAQQDAQLASIGDWALTKVRGGGEDAAIRMTELQSIAVLQTLDKLGAKGKALADDIRAVRDEEQFLGGFYPKSESATANNLSAMGQGADIYSRPGASSLPTNALADAALMGTGLASGPILTAMRQGPKLYRGMMQPRISTREDMTRVLMSRPKPGARVLSSRADKAQAPLLTETTPPAGPTTGLGGPAQTARPIPGQTSSASPTVTGALVGGGLGYVASDGDPVATLAGATGLGAAAGLGAKMLKGGKVAKVASGSVPVKIPPFDGPAKLRELLGEPSKYLPWRNNPQYKELAAKAGQNVGEAPVANIVPGQSQIRHNFKEVKQRYGDTDADLPILVREGGKYYINDGTHRIAAQVDDGAKTIRARIIDLDAVAPKAPAGASLQNAEKILSDFRIARELSDDQLAPVADAINTEMRRLQNKMVEVNGERIPYSNTREGYDRVMKLNGLLMNAFKDASGEIDIAKAMRWAEKNDPDRAMRVEAGRAVNDLQDGVRRSKPNRASAPKPPPVKN
jgi:hypothetical protein